MLLWPYQFDSSAAGLCGYYFKSVLEYFLCNGSQVANVDPDLCRHVTLLGHNVLMEPNHVIHSPYS